MVSPKRQNAGTDRVNLFVAPHRLGISKVGSNSQNSLKLNEKIRDIYSKKQLRFLVEYRAGSLDSVRNSPYST